MKMDWVVAGIVCAPPIAVWLWAMARAIRERLEIRRIMRETRGRGMP
jgi:hypothetical protein